MTSLDGPAGIVEGTTDGPRHEQTVKRRRGRRRVAEPKSAFVRLRCTERQHAELAERADRAGLSVAAYIMAMSLGEATPRGARRPPIERRLLAKLLGETGKIGSNINQIARALNMGQTDPDALQLAPIQAELSLIRDALMAALGREG